MIPLVYDCQPTETSPRLNNILLKLYFDLEKYVSNKESPEKIDLDAALFKEQNELITTQSQTLFNGLEKPFTQNKSIQTSPRISMVHLKDDTETDLRTRTSSILLDKSIQVNDDQNSLDILDSKETDYKEHDEFETVHEGKELQVPIAVATIEKPYPQNVLEKLELSEDSYQIEQIKVKPEVGQSEIVNIIEPEKETPFSKFKKLEIESNTSSDSDGNKAFNLMKRKKKTSSSLVKNPKQEEPKKVDTTSETDSLSSRPGSVSQLIRKIEQPRLSTSSSSNDSKSITQIGGLMVTKRFDIETEKEKLAVEEQDTRRFSDKAGSLLRKLVSNDPVSRPDHSNLTNQYQKTNYIDEIPRERSFSDLAVSILSKTNISDTKNKNEFKRLSNQSIEVNDENKPKFDLQNEPDEKTYFTENNIFY